MKMELGAKAKNRSTAMMTNPDLSSPSIDYASRIFIGFRAAIGGVGMCSRGEARYI
jgi:hypothetical protein